MKIKKFFITFFLLSVVLLVSACTIHKHTFSTDWSSDAEKHWHDATCEHATIVGDSAKHSFDSGSVTVEPTCKSSGEKTLSCNVCGYTKTETIPALTEHNWDEGQVTKSPTCKEVGTMTYTCLDCSTTKEESIEQINHTAIDEWLSDDENHWHECECGKVMETEAHIADEGVVTTEATCKDEGVKTFSCTVCEKVLRTEVIPTDDSKHTFDDGVVTTEATCTLEGIMTYTCSLCEATKTETIEALGHSSNEGVVTKEASCDEVGIKTYSCTKCSGVLNTEEIEMLPHTPGEYTYTSGYRNTTCTVCDTAIKEEYLSAEVWNNIDASTVKCVKNNNGSFTVSFTTTGRWGEFVLTYGDVVLTKDNVSITGDYRSNAYHDDLSNYVYYELGGSQGACWVAYDLDGVDIPHSFAVVYNPTENVLDIRLIDQSTCQHTWDDGEVTVHSTCQNKGEKLYTCTICCFTKTLELELDLNNHESTTKWSQGENTHWHECGCGVKLDEAEHTWDEGSVTTEPTCKDKGKMTYTCNDCGSTKIADIEVVPHTPNEGDVTKEATCKEEGLKTISCSVCGQQLSTKVIPLAEHTLGEDAVVVNPTCKEAGSKTFTCEVCDETFDEVIPVDPTAHNLDDGVVSKKPTCVEKGTKTYTCLLCGETVSEEIEVDLTAHSYDEGEITSEPTCAEEGLLTYTCLLCGQTKTEVLEKDESKHAYNIIKSDSEGHWYECNCSEKTEKVEHNYDGGDFYNEISDVYTCNDCYYKKYVVIEDDLTVGVDQNKYGLAIRTPEGRDLKIAQFADIHFGVDGHDWHNFDIERIKAFIRDVVERNRPDLIVCSGDNIIGTGVSNSNPNEHDLIEFVEFVDSFEIPWMFLYGNHDAETKNKKDYSDYLLAGIEDGSIKHLLYQEEYIEVADKTTSKNDLGRYGNYSVQLLNPMGDKLIGSIIAFDAGTYLYDLSKYQTITEGQIAWYEQKIANLQAIYSAQEKNTYDVIPTIVFSHIQLPQHKTGYSSAYKEDGLLNAEFVIRQDEVASGLVDKKSETDTGLFAKMVELRSTKAFFVGHAHTYKFQVKVDGIVLGYAPITGISKLDGDADLPREMYIYNFTQDLAFTTTVMDEHITEPDGLTYSYSGSDDENTRMPFNYDKTSGKYYIVLDMIKWGRIRLRHNGVILTPENTNITGAYSGTTNVTDNLYYGKDKMALYNGTGEDKSFTKFALVYDPLTNTLDISPVKEFSYAGYKSADVDYNVIDGNYSFEVTLPQWQKVSFIYNGANLNASNTTISGFYSSSNTNTGTLRLYTDSDANQFLTGHTTPVSYKFTYIPRTNELIFDVTAVNGVSLDSNSGLVYTGTSVGKATYDKNTNSYKAEISMKQWHSTEFFFNGEVVDVFNSEAVLLVNNTALYKGNPDSKIVNPTANVVYEFIYSPKNGENKAKLVMNNISIKASAVNKDAAGNAIAIWTEEGTKLKSGVDSTDAKTIQASYVGGGWRTYIIVDAEGRIAYLVHNPVNGYGGYGGTSYYCHSYYNDKTNPVFNVLSGWEAWKSGSGKHNLYDLVIPSGGFAITSHGTATDQLLELLGVEVPDFRRFL